MTKILNMAILSACLASSVAWAISKTQVQISGGPVKTPGNFGDVPISVSVSLPVYLK